MKWASAVSEDVDLHGAAVEASAIVKARLGDVPPDLAVVFVSDHHQEHYADFAVMIKEMIRPRFLIGCSAGGVIGGGREIEQRPGVSVTAALLPDVKLHTFHLEHAEMPDLDSSPKNWSSKIGVDSADDPQFIVFADPFSIDAEAFLRGMDFAFPVSKKVGGLASGSRSPGGNALYMDDEIWNEGAIGIALSGDIEVETIVAQGCRPIGAPLFVTKCRDNVLLELDGRPVLEVLQEIYEALSAEDQALFRHSLFLGIVMDEFKQQYAQGDFLIRNMIGMDRESGAIGVGALLKPRQVVQFHLRDAATSSEDLESMLSSFDKGRQGGDTCGSLLFSCLGRGMYLYGEADHDTKAFRRHLGDVPLGGFFCNGEVGPVHGTTFVHGYTSSFGLFRPKT